MFAALQLDPIAAPAFLVLGLACGWLYRRTGCLSVPILASAVCSFLVVVLPILLGGMLDPAYLQEFMSEFLQKFANEMNK